VAELHFLLSNSNGGSELESKNRDGGLQPPFYSAGIIFTGGMK
jgi:hypothetical protein